MLFFEGMWWSFDEREERERWARNVAQERKSKNRKMSATRTLNVITKIFDQ
jgi:hypothetical protein